jgi:hypothetical protein
MHDSDSEALTVGSPGAFKSPAVRVTGSVRDTGGLASSPSQRGHAASGSRAGLWAVDAGLVRSGRLARAVRPAGSGPSGPFRVAELELQRGGGGGHRPPAPAAWAAETAQPSEWGGAELFVPGPCTWWTMCLLVIWKMWNGGLGWAVSELIIRAGRHNTKTQDSAQKCKAGALPHVFFWMKRE